MEVKKKSYGLRVSGYELLGLLGFVGLIEC